MSYYMPQGDYKTYGYAGDPGFLSSLWKGVKKVAKIALPIFGGPVGRIVAGVGAGTAAAKILTPPTFPGVSAFGPGGVPGVGARGPSMRGAGFEFPTTKGMAPYDPSACPPSGYHWAKDGSGRAVRNRRMNVANPRALRRALRRTDGFVKLAKRSLKGTGYAVRRA